MSAVEGIGKLVHEALKSRLVYYGFSVNSLPNPKLSAMKACSFTLITTTVLLLALLSACEKTETTGPATPPPLALVSPLGIEQSASCCITFSWASNSPHPANLQVARDSTFDDLLLDTLLHDDFFLFEAELPPKTTYYWRVQVSIFSEESFFVTEDLISTYEGTHEFEISKFSWRKEAPEPVCDTTYVGAVEISLIDNEIVVSISDLDISRQHTFVQFANEHEVIYHQNGGGNHGAYLHINTETDSIFGGGEANYLGGGYEWRYRGKAE